MKTDAVSTAEIQTTELAIVANTTAISVAMP
jgi:hypothetical protein